MRERRRGKKGRTWLPSCSLDLTGRGGRKEAAVLITFTSMAMFATVIGREKRKKKKKGGEEEADERPRCALISNPVVLTPLT